LLGVGYAFSIFLAVKLKINHSALIQPSIVGANPTGANILSALESPYKLIKSDLIISKFTENA